MDDGSEYKVTFSLGSISTNDVYCYTISLKNTSIVFDLLERT